MSIKNFIANGIGFEPVGFVVTDGLGALDEGDELQTGGISGGGLVEIGTFNGITIYAGISKPGRMSN